MRCILWALIQDNLGALYIVGPDPGYGGGRMEQVVRSGEAEEDCGTEDEREEVKGRGEDGRSRGSV